jgi:predicted GIY-YIG superfamily endonuclease
MKDPDEAASVMRAANLEPLEPYPGVKVPWRARCQTCGEEVAPHFSTVQNGGGCRYCAPYGIDLKKPSSVYLLRHNHHEALKVGITNDRVERLIEHERQGWSLIDLWSFDSGRDAQNVEQTVIAAWNQFEYAVTAEEMPQRGYTETVSLEDVSEAEAVALIEAAISPPAGSE